MGKSIRLKEFIANSGTSIISEECDVDVRNDDGETPLMKAAFYDYGEIARLLLKEG